MEVEQRNGQVAVVLDVLHISGQLLHGSVDGLNRCVQRIAGKGFRRQRKALIRQQSERLLRQLAEHGKPFVCGDLTQRIKIRPGRREGGVRHPHVLDPQPRIQRRIARSDDVERLLCQMLVGDHSHGGEHREEDREADQHRQAGGKGIDALLAVELLQLFVHLVRVFFVLLLEFCLHGGNLLHLAHPDTALVVERHDDQTHQQREQHDRPAVVAHEAVNPFQYGLQKFVDAHEFIPFLMWYRGLRERDHSRLWRTDCSAGRAMPPAAHP